jgi:CubicO group peptidase (beta-lactamase class C family)
LAFAVVGIARRGQIAYLEAFGQRDVGTAQSMRVDAIFSVASMTKPMTSAAIMILHEEGRLLLGDPVSKFLPTMAGMKVARTPTADAHDLVPAIREMTVQDLLRHTSGLTYANRGTSPVHRAYPGSSVEVAVKLGREEFLAAIGKVPLLYQPGSTWDLDRYPWLHHRGGLRHDTRRLPGEAPLGSARHG